MKAKNSLTSLGTLTAGGNVQVGDQTTIRVAKGSKRAAYYPAGCIGANLAKRNYVKYLVERYHQYREADERLGRNGSIPLCGDLQEHRSRVQGADLLHSRRPL